MKKISITILCVSFVISSFSQERKELRKNSPNRIILQLGGGVFSNFIYAPDPTTDEMKVDGFRMSNVTYSGMLGYRSGFNGDNYRFSSTGRDRNWGNVLGVFYQTGTLDAGALAGLDKDETKIFINNVDQTVRFSELQIGGVWKETFRISGGRGSVKALEGITVFSDIEELTQTENIDYNLFTAGFSWRFGRFSPTFNWTIMSADNFETTMSRFDIQICMNLYFWKKILHKDKHLIKD